MVEINEKKTFHFQHLALCLLLGTLELLSTFLSAFLIVNELHFHLGWKWMFVHETVSSHSSYYHLYSVFHVNFSTPTLCFHTSIHDMHVKIMHFSYQFKRNKKLWNYKNPFVHIVPLVQQKLVDVVLPYVQGFLDLMVCSPMSRGFL